MKARKTMKNQALIQEVISQISQRFAPKIPDIKKVRYYFFRLTSSTGTKSFTWSGDRNTSRERIHGTCRWLERYIRIYCLRKPWRYGEVHSFVHSFFCTIYPRHIINASCNLEPESRHVIPTLFNLLPLEARQRAAFIR